MPAVIIPILLVFLLISNFAAFTVADLVNVTIDDTSGDGLTTRTVPSYGQDCVLGFTPCNPDCGPGCSVDCEHAPLLPPSSYHTCVNDNLGSQIRFSFQGSAIYLYHDANARNAMYALVTLDGVLQTNYTWAKQEDAYEWWWYNVTLFSKDGLAAGDVHNVTIQSSRIVFNFAVYTTDRPVTSISSSASTSTGTSVTASHAPSTSLKHHNNAGAIAGGIVGGLALLVILFTVLWACRRRDSRKADTMHGEREMAGPVHGVVSPAQANGETYNPYNHAQPRDEGSTLYEPLVLSHNGQVHPKSPSSQSEIVEALPQTQGYVNPPVPSSSPPPQQLPGTHPDHEALVRQMAELQSQVARLTAERNLAQQPQQQPQEPPPGYKDS